MDAKLAFSNISMATISLLKTPVLFFNLFPLINDADDNLQIAI